ncbi:autotransporter domain-containing protein [Pseudomonas sp. NPDC087358]|uniref:autotransporter domain-containing protein n=1 Tax=Pseudomonas sp. NPDC087358 TaxID=3364439 RepID=UPI00384AE623
MTALGSAVAQAAPVSQVVSFGDSNADAGVGAALSLSVFTHNPSPTVGSVGGRFSNGPVAVEDVASDLGVSLASYGVGGATTGAYAFGVIPSLLTQIPLYQATLASAALDPRALYVITAGSNDLYGLTSSVPAATVANGVNNIQSAVTTLSNAGARIIIVVNRTVRPNPDSVDNANGVTLNAALQSKVSQLDAGLPGRVLYLDAYGISSALQANPATYGLTGGSAQCIENPACISDPTGLGATYVRFDSAHFALGANAIIAQEMERLVVMQDAPSQVALLPALAVNIQRQDADNALAAGPFQRNDPVGTVRPIAVAHYSEQAYDRAGHDADANVTGLMLGAKYKLSEAWILGLLVGYDRVDVDRRSNQAGVDARQTYGFATLQYAEGPVAFDAAVGYGDADLQRITRESPMFASGRLNSGDSTGYSLGGVAKLSYDLYTANGLRIGPMLQLDSWQSKLDGYTEQGSDSSALRFDDFSVSATRIGAGPRVRFDAGSAASQLSFDFSALYLHDVASDGGKITASSPRFSFINHAEKGRDFDDDTLQLNASVSRQWGPLQARLGLSGRLGNDSRTLGSAADVSYAF